MGMMVLLLQAVWYAGWGRWWCCWGGSVI